MSAHDRAAARHARRFTLTVIKCDPGAVQSWDVANLTETELEAEKKHVRECWDHPPYQITFEVSAA